MTHLLAAALVLQISNFSGAPAAIVRDAQHEVTRLYDAIGVHTEWIASPGPSAEPQSTIRVVLLPYETGDLRGRDRTVMGAATRTAAGNAVAYVFYRRVRAEADRYDVPAGAVLACAIAHELGHLLLPHDGHGPAGLMRASWTGDEFLRAQQGLLRFLPAEAERIRAGLDLAVEHERGDGARH
jgi:hypothetical protein